MKKTSLIFPFFFSVIFGETEPLQIEENNQLLSINEEEFEWGARWNQDPSRAAQMSYLSSYGKELSISYRSGEFPSSEEGVLQTPIFFPTKTDRIFEIHEKQSDLLSLNPENENHTLPTLPYKSPILAASLASLFPGFGHIYLGDYKTAGTYIGSMGIGLPTQFVPNRTIQEIDIYSVECAWFYNIYAAYRDARNYNHNSGYLYPMPQDSFQDLALAPFNYKVLKKPQVWGGLLAKMTTVFILSAIFHANHDKKSSKEESLKSIPTPIVAFPVGIAEESLFRGYLQPQLSEYFNPLGGLILSSALFGAAHIPNAQGFSREEKRKYYTFSIPIITLAGFYYGWLAKENQSLQECVAVHSWYDFILFCLARVAKEKEMAVPVKNQFSVTIPF